jgi:molybdopterin/thiamine biosynthesis adenylyltransferase
MKGKTEATSGGRKKTGAKGRVAARRDAIFSRVEGIFETKKLCGKKVAIIGLGTGGSLCADELARCAVDHFRLVDFDRLEPPNIARHTCGLSGIGRFKTEAVADRIRDVNPACHIKRYEKDIVKDHAALEQVVKGSDLVLACTDNNRSRYAINEACLRLKVPAIYAGAYERAFGGFVMRVIPGKTPCYDCVIGSVQKSVGDAPYRQGPIAYSDIEDASQFKAEPGLSIDVHMIALIQAKMALLTLLRGTDSKLEDYPTDFLFWGNRREWIFPEPLYCKFAKTAFREDCPTCQSIRAGRQKAAARKEAKAIIAGAIYDADLFQRARGK